MENPVDIWLKMKKKVMLKNDNINLALLTLLYKRLTRIV